MKQEDLEDIIIKMSRNRKNFGEYNKVMLVGTIEEKPTRKNNKFFYTTISVERPSGTVDNIPLEISEKKLISKGIKKGSLVEIQGDFKSYMQQGHREMFLNAKEVRKIEGLDENPSLIYLRGYICHEPYYHETATVHKHITAFTLAIPRNPDNKRSKADYLQCLAWECDSQMIKNCQVGQEVELYGRIQSRHFYPGNDMNVEPVKVCEVSIYKHQVWLL